MKKYLLLSLSLLGMLIAVLPLFAVDPPTYRLINSDSFQATKAGEEYISYLVGNVHFFYNEIEFYSDRAEIYEQRQDVFLMGRVVCIQDTLRITCDEAYYYHKTSLLRLISHVVITQTQAGEQIKTTRIVTANQANHDRDKGTFTLTGNVIAHAMSDSVYAKAGFAFYDQQNNYAYMIQNPLVYKVGADSLSLSAEKIEFYESIKKVVASFGVVTQNPQIKATCDFLIYYGDEEQIRSETEESYDGKVVYIGNPQFYSDDADGNAELFTVYLVKNKIDLIYLENSSYISFKTDEALPKDSWIKSDFMSLYYKETKPTSFFAKDNVSSYFIQKSNKNKQEIYNNVSSETLNISFNDDSKVQDIRVNKSVSGMYKFVK